MAAPPLARAVLFTATTNRPLIMPASEQQLSLLLARQRQLNESQNAKLARRIHDEISQPLTVLAFELSLLLPPGGYRKTGFRLSPAKIQELARLVQQTHETVREITNELRPKILDEFGFEAALGWLCQRINQHHGVHCQVIRNGSELNLRGPLSNDLFWLVHELICEILQPAKVPHIEIHLLQTSNSVRVEVRAKGKAIPRKETDPVARLGWISIHDRAGRLKSKLLIQSLSPRASSVVISVPLTTSAPRIKHQKPYAPNSNHR